MTKKTKQKTTRVYTTKSELGVSTPSSYRFMPETHKKLNQLSTSNRLSKTAVIEILIKNSELEVK